MMPRHVCLLTFIVLLTGRVPASVYAGAEAEEKTTAELSRKACVQMALRDNPRQRRMCCRGHEREIAIYGLEESREHCVINVLRTYWELYHAIQALNIAEKQVHAWQELQKKNKTSHEAKIIPYVDIVRTDSIIASCEADVALWRGRAACQSGVLRGLIDPCGKQLKRGCAIVPSDTPVLSAPSVNFAAALKEMMQNKFPTLQQRGDKQLVHRLLRIELEEDILELSESAERIQKTAYARDVLQEVVETYEKMAVVQLLNLVELKDARMRLRDAQMDYIRAVTDLNLALENVADTLGVLTHEFNEE